MTRTHEAYAYLNLANVSPDLNYDYDRSSSLAASDLSIKELIRSYFNSQPEDYRRELRKFSELNNRDNSSTNSKPKAWVFVPCFNEDNNLSRIVKLFDQQQFAFELCFILNCQDSQSNYLRLVKSLEILLEAKRSRPYIHIVTKVFTQDTASLGRARKYGFDYCLQRISEHTDEVIENAFVLCTEGDTLELCSDYLECYANEFAKRKCSFVQGSIEYPSSLLSHSQALKYFTSVREAVYAGQSLHTHEFPEFEGIMPCGRNFGLDPELYCRIGGIDPVRRAGPEDDIIMGSDIVRLLGESAKCMANIPLVTSPRREVLIIQDMLRGQDNNLKQAYEDFHNALEIRDYDHNDIERVVLDEFPQTIDESFASTLLSQLYQWMISSVLKEVIASLPEAKSIVQEYRRHRLGYWEKENQLWELGTKWLRQLPSDLQRRKENYIADKALYWFRKFNAGLPLTFLRSDQGHYSTIICREI